MALLVNLARLVASALLFASGAAHGNSSLRIRERETRFQSVVPNNATESSRPRNDHHRHHQKDHAHIHFESSEPNSHEPCGARISLEEHRMMDEAQEVWEEQNQHRTRHLRQARSLLSVQIDVWFHV